MDYDDLPDDRVLINMEADDDSGASPLGRSKA